MSIPSKVLQRQIVVDNLVTQTFYKVRNTVVDQVFRATPFFDKMVEGGRLREKAPDGTHFEIPVRYAKADQNIQYIGRGTRMGRKDKETLTRILYKTAALGDSMVRYWADERINRGEAKLIDYVNELVENHTLSLRDKVALDVLVQDADPEAIQALPTLIATDPTTDTIAMMSRAANPWMRNQTMSFSGLTTKANLLDRMETMYNLCSMLKGSGSRSTPDVIITTREIYQDYVGLARLMGVFQMNTVTKRVDFGTGEASFKGAEIFWDENAPAGEMRFLNTSTLQFAYDPQNWFEMTAWKTEADTLDRTAQVVAVGNLVCDNFQKNGVIHSITPTSI